MRRPAEAGVNPIGEPIDQGVPVVHTNGTRPAPVRGDTDRRRDEPADLPEVNPEVGQRPAGAAPLG
jgi:hypothetical protein